MKAETKTLIGGFIGLVVFLGFLYVGSRVVGAGFSAGSK